MMIVTEMVDVSDDAPIVTAVIDHGGLEILEYASPDSPRGTPPIWPLASLFGQVTDLLGEREELLGFYVVLVIGGRHYPASDRDPPGTAGRVAAGRAGRPNKASHHRQFRH